MKTLKLKTENTKHGMMTFVEMGGTFICSFPSDENGKVEMKYFDELPDFQEVFERIFG